VLSTVDMVVQRRDGPRRLPNDDDDVQHCPAPTFGSTNSVLHFLVLTFGPAFFAVLHISILHFERPLYWAMVAILDKVWG